MINALIVCSEPQVSETLVELLRRHCPQVLVAGVYTHSAEALAAIQQQRPQLLFLQIQHVQPNGFDLLEHVGDAGFEVIFISCHDHFAVKAIHFNALGYLVTPIDPQELQMAVGKVGLRFQKLLTQQLDTLVEKINHPATPVQKIALPTQQGLQMVYVAAIISCTSHSNYSILNLKGKNKMVVSRTLKEIEGLLQPYSFLRVHHSHLVNLNEVEKYIKGEGGILVMTDGSQVDVSRSKKELLMQKLLHLKP